MAHAAIDGNGEIALDVERLNRVCGSEAIEK
jgi:hypothetical protein